MGAGEDVEFGLGILWEADGLPPLPALPDAPGGAGRPRRAAPGAGEPEEPGGGGPDAGGPDGPDAGGQGGDPGYFGEEPPGGGDPGAGGVPPPEPMEAVQAQVRRERLYDNVEELEGACRQLRTAADTVSERARGEGARARGREIRAQMEEAERQLALVRRHLPSLGDARAQAVFDSARERVGSASLALKHLIDTDGSFRAAGAEPAQTPEEAPK